MNASDLIRDIHNVFGTPNNVWPIRGTMRRTNAEGNTFYCRGIGAAAIFINVSLFECLVTSISMRYGVSCLWQRGFMMGFDDYEDKYHLDDDDFRAGFAAGREMAERWIPK